MGKKRRTRRMDSKLYGVHVYFCLRSFCCWCCIQSCQLHYLRSLTARFVQMRLQCSQTNNIINALLNAIIIACFRDYCMHPEARAGAHMCVCVCSCLPFSWVIMVIRKAKYMILGFITAWKKTTTALLAAIKYWPIKQRFVEQTQARERVWMGKNVRAQCLQKRCTWSTGCVILLSRAKKCFRTSLTKQANWERMENAIWTIANSRRHHIWKFRFF